MLPITKKISKFNFSSRNGAAIRYIVLHYTGNNSDTALANANWFNTCDRNASAHYFVDDDSIYQVVEDSNSAWAVGDGRGLYGIRNRESISIEMCTKGNYVVSQKTENNTVELVKYLMKKYNIPISNVVRHYDASRKICPNWSANNWARWKSFKMKLTNETTWKLGWNKNDTGWFYCTDVNKKYYYTSKNGWKQIDGEWYRFDDEGYALQNDWYYDRQSGNWFYLDNACKMVHTTNEKEPKWIWIDRKCYAFNKDGVMYKDCVTPDGYTVQSDGAWDQNIHQKK